MWTVPAAPSAGATAGTWSYFDQERLTHHEIPIRPGGDSVGGDLTKDVPAITVELP